MGSLKSVPKDQRSSILSSLGAYFLPTPSEKNEEPSPMQRKVLEEIAAKFGYSGLQAPSDLLPAVQRMLFRELSSSLMESKPQDLRARVGQKGLLPTDHYDISYEPHFMTACIKMGVSKRLVEATIAKPGSVEHLFPDQAGIVGIPSHSLFVQAHPTIGGCSVLILAIRRASRLHVEGGWLIFHDLVGSLPTDAPLTLLQKFAEHYGVEFKVGELREKFILQTEVKSAATSPQNLFEVQGSLADLDMRLSFAFSYGVVKIGLAFTIIVSRYVDDLVNRGVRVTREWNRPRKSLLSELH